MQQGLTWQIVDYFQGTQSKYYVSTNVTCLNLIRNLFLYTI